MTRVHAARLGALLITTVLAVGCAGGDGGDETSDSASYGTETLMPAVVDAVGAHEYVHLGLGDQRGRHDVAMKLSWADPPEFSALTSERPFLEVRQVNGRVYVGGEAARGTWTYLPVDDPRVQGEDPDFDAGVVPTLAAVDVPGELEALVDAVTKVENEGTEQINGVPSTHYVVTVDPAMWQDSLSETSFHRQMELEDPAVLDLWIDEGSLPVRLEYVGTGGRSETVRIDYSSWGVPIAVVEPEDAEPLGSSPS